jgi:hypothetical protein
MHAYTFHKEKVFVPCQDLTRHLGILPLQMNEHDQNYQKVHKLVCTLLRDTMNGVHSWRVVPKSVLGPFRGLKEELLLMLGSARG